MSGEIKPLPGAGGILPADRIFALLEQEFPVADVRRAVAAALRPKAGAGLGPHRSLIDLSRTPDGAVRLVTTNFDRVFEQADPSLMPIVPPNLPDPQRPGALNGIIHLHGKVSLDYSAPESPEFVLSSADFGRAYLADGWATTFMRALMNRYRIVFVGYSADDPPMQYLLEALQVSAAPGRLYALQEGEASYASGLWRHKGVTAIPFDGFPALWETLAAWAERARAPDSWRRSIAAMAVAGPRDLSPYQRGQVAHLVSSALGAGVFAKHEPAPPAEWLCAFDPDVRYDQRRSLTWRDPEPDHFDPFDSYGLDNEIPPIGGEEQPSQHAPPPDSWSALEAVPGERPTGRNPSLASLRGPASTAPPRLPLRLLHLARWFGRVAIDPVAIWWASGQNVLHPEIAFQVREAVLKDGVPSNLQRAWGLLLAALSEPHEDVRDKYEFQRVIRAEGWSRLSVIRLVEVERPRLAVRRPMTAPIADRTNALRLVEAHVNYPEHNRNLEVPPEHLLDYIDGTRRNLVLATRLEEEVGGFALDNLSPLNPFEREPNEFTTRTRGLSSLMAQLSMLVRRLLEIAPDLAAGEVRSWRSHLGRPFRNLRVWAASEPSLTSPDEAATILLSLDEDVWEVRLERDLLTAMRARWSHLPRDCKARIEAMTLAGPKPRENVDLQQFEPYRINAVLRRLFWMEREGMEVSFNLPAEIERCRERLPGWDAREAADQLDRSPSRGGYVRTDKSHSVLLDVPLDQLLAEAETASRQGRDFFMEARPFRGLVESRPARALAALRRAAARGEEWSWAWNDLLWADARGNDSQRFRCLLAWCLAELPEAILTTNLRAAVQWFTSHSKPIWESDRDLYLATWQLLSDAVERHPEAASSALVVRGRHDWVNEAINSPGGRLAGLLCDELGWTMETQQPDSSLKIRAARMLSMPPGVRAHAAARITMRANWLYAHDRGWTEAHLLPLIEAAKDADVADAAQAGFLFQSNFPPDDLFLRLKPVLLAMLAVKRSSSRGHDNLVELVLAGWFRKRGDGQRLLSSEDLRETLITTGEEQRLSVLRAIARWAEETEECARQTTEFLDWVWPRQLAARSPAASAALAEIALRAGARMPEVTAAVLPVLEATAEPIHALLHVLYDEDDQISRFPVAHLTLLYVVLPEDAQVWPWGTAQVVEKLAGIELLKNDPRLSELRRRLARI